MKNASKNGRQALATLLFLFGLLAAGYSAPPTTACSCSSPNVSITGQTSNSASFSWTAVSGASSYVAWYVRVDDNYTSLEVVTGNTSVSFSNLPRGTYKFHFYTVCGEEVSEIIITDDLIMA